MVHAVNRAGDSKNIRSLQALRALAAVMVVFWHSRLAIMHAAHDYWVEGDAAFRAAHYPAFLNHLDAGVDIFFCISGYIMCLLISRLDPSIVASASFMAKRILRIFPPYWFFTALVVAAFLVSHGKFNIGFLSGILTTDAAKILNSLFLLPQNQAPVLGVGWTLVHEFLFYWLCSLAILCGLNRRLPEVLLLISLLASVLSLLNVSVLNGYVLSTFNIEFLFGALAFRWGESTARAYPKVQIVASIVCYVLVCKALDADMGAHTMLLRPVGFGIMGFLLISGLYGLDQHRAMLRSPAGMLAIRIGDASYTLYLSHWFVLSIMGKLLGLVPNVPVVVVAVWQCASIGAAIGLAVWLAERVELPVHRCLLALFENLLNRNPGASPARGAPGSNAAQSPNLR